MAAIFVVGALLRIALTWVNPPLNAWDNHFEPISLLLSQGGIPPKFACFQCYHPPVFYAISAAAAWAISAAGLGGDTGLKLLQLLNCAFGVAALLITLAIVRLVRIGRAAQLSAALVIALLPRHIYVSAAHGNDALAVLLVTVVIWILMTLGDGRRSLVRYAALGTAASLAIFTKYNALVVLPAIAFAIATLPAFRAPTRSGHALGRAMLALGIPALLLAAAMASNLREYGAPLPDHHEYVRRNPGAADFIARQPRDRPGVDFVGFTPWRFVSSPLLKPGQLNEFCTLMQASAWFDSDARFVLLLAPLTWTEQYYAWLRGDAPYESSDPGAHGRFALALGSVLGVLGLAMLALVVTGAATLLLEWRRGTGPSEPTVPAAGALMIVLAFNVAGVAYWAARVPVYSAMKSSFLLPSMSALTVLLALGFAAAERWRPARLAARFAVGSLAIVVTIHVAQFVVAYLTGQLLVIS